MDDQEEEMLQSLQQIGSNGFLTELLLESQKNNMR